MGRIAKWKLLPDEEFKKLVSESRSYQDLARRIGYVKTGGGTQEMLKKVIAERNLDISHFTGQGWSKGNHNYNTFRENSIKKNGRTLLAAIVDLRGRECEQCHNTLWLGQPINLEVHHKDGNHNNNSLYNLQLLCPNCHSYTENFRGRNNTGKIKVSDEQLVEALNSAKTIAQALKSVGLSLGSGNYHRANELIVKFQIQKFLS